MSSFDKIKEKFKLYNPLIFNLSNLEDSDILDYTFDTLLSNNVSYPQLTLGFQHFIHKIKDKMVLTEKYNNRKKIYLVTSLFEKNIDYKEETDNGIKFTSINQGVESFLSELNSKLPPLLNRAFLKLWEIIIMFDLIPEIENFTSSHLAEGPGSFIQATIYYRELQEKLKKIKTSSKDNYYGVTLHSDHEHLKMQEEFIKYFDKEKSKRLHILETKSVKEIKDMYGGGHNTDLLTNGDLTKLNTINIFGGSKNTEGFAKPSDLITADGGFDWKNENLQEQEAYRLIFSEIVTALKIQKNNGNFVLKIFDCYTISTLKMIELLRVFYKEVYICKPYTSRISNSEKYLVCKFFEKSKLTQSVMKKLEDFIVSLNKNENFNIIDIITDYKISEKNIEIYKKINIELMIKQYLGINNIILFDQLDNKNGIEYNDFLDKQINAALFWNDLFLDTMYYSKFNKYIKNYDYFEQKVIYNSEENENSEDINESNEESINEKSLKSKKSSKSKQSRTKVLKKITKKNKTKFNQKGGNLENDTLENDILESEILDNKSINSNEENDIGRLESDEEYIDLSKN
jgi:23S rRNA U2552 (ribose-2'-O)-methylase RlmE/FtsJ